MKPTRFNHLSALSLLAMCGPVHRTSVRFDKEALTEAEFQEQVLKETKETATKIGKITEDLSRVDKETKKAIEDVLKVAKTAQGRVEELELANKKLMLQMSRERSNVLSDPVQRIKRDDEKCARIAAMMARGFLTSEGESVGLAIARQFGIVGKAEGEDAGFGASLITPDLARDIYDSLAQYGAFVTLGNRRLNTKVTEFPVKTARAQSGWLTSEGVAISEDSTKAGTTVTATVRPIGVLLSVSMQLLQDSPLMVVADVLDDFLEGNAQTIDWAAFSGNGTLDYTNGGFTGIFTGGTAAVAATGHTSFPLITYKDVLSVLTSVDEVVLQRPARWWMHPFALVTLMGITDSTGRPIFQSILERPAPSAIGTILGYPVTLVSNAPYTSAVSSPLLAFGDPQSQVVGIREDFAFGYSDDYHFNTYQRAYRGISRAAIAMRKASAFGVLTTSAS